MTSERASYADATLSATPHLRRSGGVAVQRLLQKIADEADMANYVIALNRDGGGQGRVKVATAMHRIAVDAKKALSTLSHADGLEVVAWRRQERQTHKDFGPRIYTTTDAGLAKMWEHNEYTEWVEPLVRLSDAQDAIARLEYERDVWRSKSSMHQKAAVGRTVAEAERDKAEARLSRAMEAMTPSAETKAAYIGEFHERVEIANPMYEGNEDDEPETIMQDVPISWTTIKAIMAAIRARAGRDFLEGGE